MGCTLSTDHGVIDLRVRTGTKKGIRPYVVIHNGGLDDYILMRSLVNESVDHDFYEVLVEDPSNHPKLNQMSREVRKAFHTSNRHARTFQANGEQEDINNIIRDIVIWSGKNVRSGGVLPVFLASHGANFVGPLTRHLNCMGIGLSIVCMADRASESAGSLAQIFGYNDEFVESGEAEATDDAPPMTREDISGAVDLSQPAYHTIVPETKKKYLYKNTLVNVSYATLFGADELVRDKFENLSSFCTGANDDVMRDESMSPLFELMKRFSRAYNLTAIAPDNLYLEESKPAESHMMKMRAMHSGLVDTLSKDSMERYIKSVRSVVNPATMTQYGKPVSASIREKFEKMISNGCTMAELYTKVNNSGVSPCMKIDAARLIDSGAHGPVPDENVPFDFAYAGIALSWAKKFPDRIGTIEGCLARDVEGNFSVDPTGHGKKHVAKSIFFRASDMDRLQVIGQISSHLRNLFHEVDQGMIDARLAALQ